MQDFGTKSLDNLMIGLVVLLETVAMIGLATSLIGRSVNLVGAGGWIAFGVLVYVIYRLVDVILKMLLAIAQANERSARALEYIAGRKR